MKTFKEAFGTKVKELRKNRKLTQEKLAEILGLNQRQLTRIESGENFPSVDTLERLCLSLDIHPKYLFEFDWQYKTEILKTGTDDRPVLRLIHKNNLVTLKSKSPDILKEIKTKKQFKAYDSDESVFSLARKLNKPITVECFSGKERTHIKIYYPNGTIENLLTENEIQQNKTLDDIQGKLKAMPKEQLEFIELAIKALNDKKSLAKFQLLIKGIELSLN